ncbi:hypothetical protein EXS71_03330 [Candidatus Uhrbacteria bacterium]|nr:hypothetical protein [Candidatus Uhrbacteria bacterium]
MLQRDWLLSSKTAWQDLWFRSITIVAMLIAVGGSIYFLWKLLPARHDSPTMVIHYNIYLGIDQIQSWHWIWFLPGIWSVLTLLDLILAYGWYRGEFHLAWSLVILSIAWSIPWFISLVYLIRINI